MSAEFDLSDSRIDNSLDTAAERRKAVGLARSLATFGESLETVLANLLLPQLERQNGHETETSGPELCFVAN